MPNRFLAEEDEIRRQLLEETGLDPSTLDTGAGAAEAVDESKEPDIDLIESKLAERRPDVFKPADLADPDPGVPAEVGGGDVSAPVQDLVDAGQAPTPVKAPAAAPGGRDEIMRQIMGRLASSRVSPEAAAVDKISQGLYHATTRQDLPNSFFQNNRQDDLTEALRWAQLMKATKPETAAGSELKPEYDPNSDYSKSRTEFMRYADPDAVAALEAAGVRPTGKTFDAAAINLKERGETRKDRGQHQEATRTAQAAYRKAQLDQRAKNYQLQLNKFEDKLSKDELTAVRLGANETSKHVDAVSALKSVMTQMPGGLENADKFLQDVAGNGLSSRFLDDEGAAKLRQSYEQLVAEKRHELFGASLTKEEQAIADQLFGLGAGAPPERMAHAFLWLREAVKGKVGAAQAQLSQYPNGMDLVGRMSGVRFDDPVFGAAVPRINSGQGLVPGVISGAVEGVARKAKQLEGVSLERPKAPRPVVKPQTRTLSPQEQKALEWANNPNSPKWTAEKAAAIKQKLGVQ